VTRTGRVDVVRRLSMPEAAAEAMPLDHPARVSRDLHDTLARSCAVKRRLDVRMDEIGRPSASSYALAQRGPSGWCFLPFRTSRRVRPNPKAECMDRNWHRPFIDLQSQFRQAAQHPRHLRLIVGTFPGPASFDALFRRLRDEDRHIADLEGSHLIRGTHEWIRPGLTRKEIGVLSGQRDAADTFCRLAEAAGSYMPTDLRPALPFLTDERLAAIEIPIPSERYPLDEFRVTSDDWHPTPTGIWINFLLQKLFDGGQAGAFTFQIQWNRDAAKPYWPASQPRETGAILAELGIDPFLSSSTVIESVVLPALQNVVANDDDGHWLTVTQAASLSAMNTGAISRAVARGDLKSNGRTGRERRIDAIDFTRWHLEQLAKTEMQETDEQVRKKLRELRD
jgi:hypothetical protein